ncbi:MAG: hypothetical protein GX605_07285 [Chloroflexi bacterium]|nr:hypothetical protein [Chloroflexota bacterium]
MLPWPPGWADVQFIAPAGDALWSAAFARGELFRSTDLGRTWSVASAGLGNAHAFHVLEAERTLYAATDRRLFHSADDGLSWSPHPCRPDQALYALAWWRGQLWVGGEGGLVRSDDGTHLA